MSQVTSVHKTDVKFKQTITKTIFAISASSTVNKYCNWIRMRLCYYFATGRGAKYCDERVGMFVCLSVRSHISKTTRPNLTKFSVRVNCGRGLVLLRRQCTSGLWMTSCFHIMGTNEWMPQRPFEDIRNLVSGRRFTIIRYVAAPFCINRGWSLLSRLPFLGKTYSVFLQSHFLSSLAVKL